MCVRACTPEHLRAIPILPKSKTAPITNSSSVSQRCFGYEQPPSVVSCDRKITRSHRALAPTQTRELNWSKGSVAGWGSLRPSRKGNQHETIRWGDKGEARSARLSSSRSVWDQDVMSWTTTNKTRAVKIQETLKPSTHACVVKTRFNSSLFSSEL